MYNEDDVKMGGVIMKKGLNIGIVFILILIGTYIGLNINNPVTIETENESVNTHVSVEPSDAQKKEAEEIKKAADDFMFFNYAKFGKTSWFDSVKSSGAKITSDERIFIVQFTDDSQFENAKKFVGSLNMFFSDKTNTTHNVDKIVLIDKNGGQVYELETIKW
jgi:hypothetical protein